MKKFFLLLSLLIIYINQQVVAQVTDSVFVTQNIKPYLYSSLPEGRMMNSKGDEMDFIKFIKNDRPFKNKPTLFITWSNRYCPPCIRLIDSILDNNIQKRYNVVLVNKDQSKDAKEPVDDISLMRKISEAKPAYSKKAISLFDNHNILNSIDQGVAPMMFWMDKDMNIAAAFLGYAITINWIEEILDKVDNKEIVPSATKFLDINLMLVSSGVITAKQITNEFINATNSTYSGKEAYRQILGEINGIYTFTWDQISTKETLYKLNFTKTPEGYFEYHKSSLHVPKVEDLYNETDIIAAVKKMLNSLNAGDINAVKGSKGTDNWYESKLTIKNFNTSIRDVERMLVFSNTIAYPALDRSRASKKQEFHLIAKALGRCLSIKPKEEKGEFSGRLTYTYTINKDVKIFLKEDGSNVFFNLVADKDKDGNLPVNAGEKADLASLYNESKLCDAVKKIKTELEKSNKSGILGEKKGDNYASLIQIENFKGSISKNEEGYSYFRYTGYVAAQPFENGIYEKEFELISTQLQNCLNVKPQKDRSWQSSDTFITEKSLIEVGMNSKKSNMWIKITVMK